MSTFKKLGCLVICTLNLLLVAKESTNISAITPQLEEYVHKVMQAKSIPGMVVGIVQGNQLVYFKGFGTKEMGTSQPIDVETLFPIGSTTKAFGATTLAVLADQGYLKWEDEVVKHDRSFMLYSAWVTRNFQIIDLFAQHSGLPDSILTSLLVMGYPSSYVLNALRNVKPVTSFRSKFAYQNAFQLELEPLTQILMQKSWDVVARENILDPLNMRRTFFKIADFNHDENHTSTHYLWNQQVKVIPLANYLNATGAAGCITSCVQDMAKWLAMQIGNGKFQEKQIISEKNLQVTRTPQTIMDDSSFYALGWIISQKEDFKLVWHNGGIHGGNSFVGFVPEANLGIVIFANISQTSAADAIGFRFFDLALNRPYIDHLAVFEAQTQQLLQHPQIEAPKETTPPLALEKYTGKYFSSIYGDVEITINNDQLQLTCLHVQASATLDPWDRDVFLLQWKDYLKSVEFDFGAKIIFDQGPQGEILGFRYYPPNQPVEVFERTPVPNAPKEETHVSHCFHPF